MFDSKKYFAENLFELGRSEIHKASEYDAGHLNNVIIGIEKEAYGVSLIEDNFNWAEFGLIYIDGRGSLIGYTLTLRSNDKNWMNYAICFSVFLSKRFKKLDAIDVYNTFINKARTLFEKLQFFTVTNYDIEIFKDNDFQMIISNPRGYIYLEFEDKVSVYSSLFNHKLNKSEKNQVYLMYSANTNYIKIGRSKKPRVREKTLQGEDPKLVLLTYWEAPAEVEKSLHAKYSKKRIRGEWFNLHIGDLGEIRKVMEKYQN